MRATVIYGAGDIRVEDVPDPIHREPTDAIVRVTSLLHLRQRPVAVRLDAAKSSGGRIGHEFLGVVEDAGSDVAGLQAGRPRRRSLRLGRQHLRLLPGGPADLLPARRRLGRPTRTADRARRYAYRWRGHAGQAAGRRGLGSPAVPAHPVRRVRHRAPLRRDRGGRTAYDVTSSATARSGSGLAGRERLGAERIILMGRHKGRTDLGRDFGATDVVAERGEEGIECVRN